MNLDGAGTEEFARFTSSKKYFSLTQSFRRRQLQWYKSRASFFNILFHATENVPQLAYQHFSFSCRGICTLDMLSTYVL